MAFVNEYKCGCMVHSIAGTIRKCSGTVSRSLGGKRVGGGEGEARHNNAMNDDVVRQYSVADILP